MLERMKIARPMLCAASVILAGAGFILSAGGGYAAGPAVAPVAVARPPQSPLDRAPLDHAPAVPETTAAMPLAAHRALYRVTLLKSTGTKSPTSAHGRVSYEFNGSPCEGFTQNFRQITELQPAEGATRLSDMRSATFEDADGKTFAFNVTTSVDNGGNEVIDGRALKKNASLAIQISKPTHETIDVDQEVLFPTEQLQRILAAARTDQHLLGVKVFDGSDDGKKVYNTTAIIGRAMTGATDDRGVDQSMLQKIRRWPVSISYFEEGRKDEGPAYILGFDLYENGVSRALRFDYGDFILAGEMTHLDILPEVACAK